MAVIETGESYGAIGPQDRSPEVSPEKSSEPAMLELTAPELHQTSSSLQATHETALDPCTLHCPVVQHAFIGASEAKDVATKKAFQDWGDTVKKDCKVGPQKSERPRLFVVGRTVTVITCGSFISRAYKDINSVVVDK